MCVCCPLCVLWLPHLPHELPLPQFLDSLPHATLALIRYPSYHTYQVHPDASPQLPDESRHVPSGPHYLPQVPHENTSVSRLIRNL